MSSLKIVYNNAADKGEVTATSSALPHSNLLTDSKNEVWRTAPAVTSATITVTWQSLEPVSCVALPFCNFSPTATMRVRCYLDAAGTTLVYDHNIKLCCPGAQMQLYGMSAQQSASAYSHGGGVAATAYFNTVQARRVVIDIVDANNLQGYLEASRLVVGDSFSPKYNAEYGAELSLEDTTKSVRSDSGNLISDVGCRYKTVSVNLTAMFPEDRAALWKLVKYCGTNVPVFFSLFSDNEDKDLEQTYTVYGKFSSISTISASNYNIYSAPLEIEEV